MRFVPAAIPEVILIEPAVRGDGRGLFFEDYHKAHFAENGIAVDFVQDNHSVSVKGALRGLHFQAEPMAQAKLVRVIRGEAFDALVDIRKGSKTYGRPLTHVLSAENRKMIFIPPGFAHGFLALQDGTEFLYKVSKVYSPAHERGLVWNDPVVGIPWPKLDRDYILSEKDKKHPPLGELGRLG